MGNRQGGKLPTRPDFSSQQKADKRVAKWEGSTVDVDALPPHLQAAVLLSTGGHWGGHTFTSTTSPALHSHAGVVTIPPRKDGDPNFVSMILQEEKHLLSCLPDERGTVDRTDFTAADCGNTADVNRSQTASHSPSARRRNVLKPANFPHDPDISLGEFMVPRIFSDVSSSVSFPKPRCVETDPVIQAGDGVKSSAAVNPLTVACIERLDYLKRNIQQCNTEHLTHFNNTGFAQLQCEAGYDDYDNTHDSKGSVTCAHRRSKSMSPKTAALIGASQLDEKSKSTAVRKLSEPGHFVYRNNSIIIPGAWSKSEENSPVIVRKALPNPANPLIVQRTPSQSPSVERRFPANAPANCVVLGNCAESGDAEKTGQHVYQKLSFQHQDWWDSRDSSHSIRQKVTAEIALPHVSGSPVSVRKMPESPVLLSSGIQHQERDKRRQHATTRTIDERSVLDWTPVGIHRVRCTKAPTLSSCSTSSSETPSGKVPWREDAVSPAIPSGASSTSSPSTTPSSSPLTPILFCPQPKGTPVRTCTMVSQPSTAVVLASRESKDSLQNMQPATPHRNRESGDHSATCQPPDCKDAQAVSSSPHKQPSSSVVTEDTIKENSQSAVFGSVSPKLLRHRRLIKNNSNPSQHQHTFPKQSQSVHSTAANTSPRKGEHSVLVIGDTAARDRFQRVHMNDDERLSPLSQSAPSSFSLHGSSTSGSCMGNKTLGQRIREVINEATEGALVTRETSSVSFRKHTTAFTKDDIFASNSASIKSSLYSSKSTNKTTAIVYDPDVRFGHENVTGLIVERREAQTAEEHGTKVPLSHGSAEHTIQDTGHKMSGHSYHLNSSRDSCASCVSDSSQMDYYDSASFPSGVAELTQANVCRQTEWFTDGTRPRQQVALSAQLQRPGRRLVTSDTSDTLSTDRDTSSSSKRESSTSTATDDTLTSFKTRSTADSVDYDEGFVLPESLVFIRSVDKDTPNDASAFDSDQTTIKRKLIQRKLREMRAEHELLPHRTRKKRRKQVHVQSQIITATSQHTDSTLTRDGTVREVYSDAVSDDSDLFDSKDDISDLRSSRDDISDLPSSRDDISDLPSSRDDISDLPSSRDDISDLPSSRDNISDLHISKLQTAGGLTMVHRSSDNSAIHRCVFHRSDLHSSANPTQRSADESKSKVRKPETHGDTSTELSDNDTRCIINRRSSSSQGSCASLSKHGPGHTGDSGTFLSDSHGRHVPCRTRSEAVHPAVPCTHSLSKDPHERLSAATPKETSQTARAEDGDSSEPTRGIGVCAKDADKGKQPLLQHSESPGRENTVVLSYTIYNSSC